MPSSSSNTGTRPSGLRARCSGVSGLAPEQVHEHGLEVDAELAQQDPRLHAVRRRGMVVELHRGRDATGGTMAADAPPRRPGARRRRLRRDLRAVRDRGRGVVRGRAAGRGPRWRRGSRPASRTHAWLIAERDGEPAGYAYASPHRSRAAYRWSADVAVYVDAAAPPARRRPRALRRAALAAAAPAGPVACAGITLPNDASVALHESFGFEPDRRLPPRSASSAAAWHDVGWWQLRLLPAERAAAGAARPAAAVSSS